MTVAPAGASALAGRHAQSSKSSPAVAARTRRLDAEQTRDVRDARGKWK